MSTTIKTVALSGASGAFGRVLLEALLDANFAVTVLTRPDSTHVFPPSVHVAKVNYSSTQDLTTALKGHDAVISTVGYAGVLGQEQLIDAAIAAGVTRIIPSEYGSSPLNAAARALPVFAHKVHIEAHLKRAVQGTSTTYTLVANNEFFDWDLDHGFGVNIADKTIEIFDGGEVPFTATPLTFVAAGVVAVLRRPEETANRVVRLHGARMTQNRLLALLKKYAGEEGWTVKGSSTADREGEAYAAVQREPQNFAGWAVMMLQCAVWGTKFGNDFSGENDNEMLALKELSDAEIEELVKARC